MNPTDILPAPVLDPVRHPDDKLVKEREAFLGLLPDLVQTYSGQYVAVHQGRVVGHGPDLPALAVRTYSQFGYIPIYFDLVANPGPPPVRFPSPRVLGGPRG